jgi:CubicO group peptidase (beta-lactamase class C family)
LVALIGRSLATCYFIIILFYSADIFEEGVMSTQDPIATAIEAYVTVGELAGAAALVWRGGRLQQSAAVGWRDREAGLPVERDTIFRIASMTKPITSLAAMMVLDDRAIGLDSPIADVAPEFAAMRVLRDPDGPLDETDPAARPITFDDLLTHRSGLTYGGFHTGPISAALSAALGGDIDSLVAPDDWIAGLAALPLIDQPGAGFHYGHSTDLLGQLIARIEGAPLGEVLRRRIFEPLGMQDTGFTAPAGRRAELYGFDETGKLVHRLTAAGGSTLAERPADMAYCSGGQGLWSTLDDYLAFARLFIGEGPALVRPQTLKLMTTNRLTDAQRLEAQMFGMPVFGTGHGFGLGLATVIDPATASYTRGKGGVGTVSWPGAFGGWWQADPTDRSAMIFLAHNVMEPALMALGIGLSVYGAIAEVHALGSKV